MKTQLTIVWLSLLLCIPAYAQEIMKHPRVVELEDSLKNGASDYIKARFPNSPFMVSVKADPLRRDFGRARGAAAEDLPYYSEGEDEEMRDEWDNPQVPLGALINRVKRIRVTIAVPAALKETEVNELKEGIFQILHLTPARDEVEISRKDWESEKTPWLQIYLAAAVLISLLTGLLAINRTSANRIARALSELKLSAQGNSSAAISPAALPDSDGKGKDSGKSQELKFNDPIKMKELASRHIEFLTSSPAFPNHQDIFVLDALGKEHPEKLGAILAEFPADMQKKIFSYSSAFHWVEALNEPGFLDFECLEVYQTLIQNPRSELEMDWCHTVMAVWRMSEERTSFLKSLSKDEAFALLIQMPKAIAVSEARKAFPGSWAAVLDPEFKPAKIQAQRSGEIREGAIRILPLHDIEMVRRYRDERELLDYLKTADPAEERDIYGAAPETSLIHKLRPPFYPIFDQDAGTLQWLAPSISLDHWALALFNVGKADRNKIDMHFNEKQKFLLVEKFKKFDAGPPSKASIGSARELIGRTLRKWLTDKATADAANADEAETHAA